MQVEYYSSDEKVLEEYQMFEYEEQQHIPSPYLNYELTTFEQVYSPYQPFLRKNMVYDQIDELLELNKRTGIHTPHPSKKVCLEQLLSEDESQQNPISSTTISVLFYPNELSETDDSDLITEDQDAAYEGELERLVNTIRIESLCQQVHQLPSPQQIDELWTRLQPPYKPLEGQQRFLTTYLSTEQQHLLRVGIDYDIVHDPETQAFQEWVESLCQNDSTRMLKEMARRSKVNRYLEKKHGRTYAKKVHYQIRQKVAEERLRVKGRFVTWSQALEMLNEQREHKKHWNMNEYYQIKKKLSEKFGSRKDKI